MMGENAMLSNLHMFQFKGGHGPGIYPHEGRGKNYGSQDLGLRAYCIDRVSKPLFDSCSPTFHVMSITPSASALFP